MVVIRLARVGKKNSPAYRVVIADKQRAVKRKFIEVIGHYNPTLNPKELVIDKDRAVFWMGQGAQASDTVRNLMADLGIIKKGEKVNKVYGKPVSKKTAKEGAKEDKATPAAEAEEEKTDAEEAKSEPDSSKEEEVVEEQTEEPSETEEADASDEATEEESK